MTTNILFDASRLISRTERSAPTGVDRVCLAYAEWLMARPDIRMVPVRSRHDRLVAVDPDWFDKTVRTLRKRWTSPTRTRRSDEADRLFAALRATSPMTQSVISPPPDPESVERSKTGRLRVLRQFVRSRTLPDLPHGRAYFNVGHTSLNTPDILASLKQAGVPSIVMLHDLIPITHPEFCRPGDGEKHRVRVLNAVNHATHILANSAYTAHELARFVDREGLSSPPVNAVHLGLEPRFSAVRRQETPHPYFIHVGTIEGRKNLAFLLSVWRRLQERMGERAPRLVLAGRYGWENEAVLDHLERSPNLQGLVHQTAGLGDEDLVRLMSDARAVLAPSSVEGFDLPAVEASAMGLPLIASDIPAHRELVPHAELIDPLDGLGWLAALERATLKAPVAPPYQAPTWAGHFSEVERLFNI
ncbi:MAG: glycosyltransferase family 4 protein [Brevundimonas sp.]|uniref:glycosyltransferase family 4 protein n=1 Tax=Brevundimonas sp. TaxID=1871086 RepID=UPI00403452E6